MKKLLNNLLFTLRITDRPKSPEVSKAPIKKGTGRPLDDLAMVSGLTRKQVRDQIKKCGLPYQDALKYYLYFGRLPDPEYCIVIKHFGVDQLIQAVSSRAN